MDDESQRILVAEMSILLRLSCALDKRPEPLISKIVIERPAKLAKITVHTSRPGVIIGKKGSDIEKLKKSISKIVSIRISLVLRLELKPDCIITTSLSLYTHYIISSRSAHVSQ